MSGIVAGVQSGGCCCRPLPCQCNDPNRPGAIVDRSLTAVSAHWEVDISETSLWNFGTFNGFCGSPCRCEAGNYVWGPYAYRVRGNRVRQMLDESTCFGCSSTACPSSPMYQINGSSNGLVLSQSEPYYGQAIFSAVASGPTSLSAGTWNWSGRQVGYCMNTGQDQWLYPYVRSYDSFPFIPWGQGVPLSGGVDVDPNGAYVNSQTGAYAMGRWGNNVGAMYAIAYAEIFYVPCGYMLTVSIRYLSYAGIMDLANGVFPFAFRRYFGLGSSQYVPPIYQVQYVKECRSIYDTVIGQYTKIQGPPYSYYSQGLCSNQFERSWEFVSSDTAYVS